MVQKLKKLAIIAESEQSLFIRYFDSLGKHQSSYLQQNDNILPAIKDEIEHISRIAVSLNDHKQSTVNQLLANSDSEGFDNPINCYLKQLKEPEITDLENLKNTITESFDKVHQYKIQNENMINQSMVILNQVESQDSRDKEFSIDLNRFERI